jgi:hypothetical protein
LQSQYRQTRKFARLVNFSHLSSLAHHHVTSSKQNGGDLLILIGAALAVLRTNNGRIRSRTKAPRAQT